MLSKVHALHSFPMLDLNTFIEGQFTSLVLFSENKHKWTGLHMFPVVWL
jgi:hypothetical protein